MSLNRIQKLLFSEYCEFEDMVLVESPFAETTRDGRGIRQVHLGLTPTKLVLATDMIPSAYESSVWCFQDVDPEIETFELISVYPVDCVNLSVFRRKKRQSLKAHFCNNRIVYFELGGFEKRKQYPLPTFSKFVGIENQTSSVMFWNLWCERVKFLCPEDLGSSRSETSIASSTSNSTMYLLATNQIYPTGGKPQLWCTFGAGDTYESRGKWTDKNLFMGENLEDLNAGIFLPIAGDSLMDVKTIYTPVKQLNNSYDTLVTLNTSVVHFNQIKSPTMKMKSLESSSCIRKKKKMLIKSSSEASGELKRESVLGLKINLTDIANEAVKQWETAVTSCIEQRCGRHRRRYGFSPQPHFHYGLGPWNITTGERFSVQMKRAVSMVGIRRQPVNSELRLPVSKRQLAASISYEALIDQPRSGNSLLINSCLDKLPPKEFVYFWTPEYWYRPRPSHDAYHELHDHLKRIRDYHQKRIVSSKASKRSFFWRKKSKTQNSINFMELSDDESSYAITKPKSRKSLLRNGSQQLSTSTRRESNPVKETSIQYLRRVLRLNIPLTAWDFDSTTLAYQLTMIDQELFMKISESELGILVWQQSSKNAPNVAALIAFSHRVSCLVTTEILREEMKKLRARLVARFITTADKCNKIFNFQSCRSVLSGLQSPPVYRLHATWAYIRQKHSSKYRLFEKLCRLYRDPRMPAYQRAFHHAKKNSPYLPFIGDLLAHLLDKIPTMSDDMLDKPSAEKQEHDVCAGMPVKAISSFHTRKSYASEQSSLPNILRRFLSAFRIWPTISNGHTPQPSECGGNGNKKSKVVQWSENMEQLSADAKVINSKKLYLSLIYTDNRKIRLKEVCELIKIFQKAAANYALCTSDLANEYLLKARYREDKENFIYSFRIENTEV